MFFGLFNVEPNYACSEPVPRDGEDDRTLKCFRVKRIGENGKNLTRELWGIWIDEATIKKEKFTIQCIFGELHNIEIIEKGIMSDNCESIEVIFGPKVESKAIKLKLENILKEDNGKKLTLLSFPERPKYHVFRISDHYLYEDQHPAAKPYVWATAIPHADEDTGEAFQDYFEELKKDCRRYTADNIGELNTYR